MSFETIAWKDDKVVMLNQLVLPHEVRYETYEDFRDVAAAIKNMVIRGAPAIGIAAAMGIALGAKDLKNDGFESFRKGIDEICEVMSHTRPTAVNLFWAIERMKRFIDTRKDQDVPTLQQLLIEEAQKVLTEDIENNRRLGEFGAQFVKDGDTILTHCNAGALATGGYGTATSVIRVAHEQGKSVRVLCDETRPYLQGARLTAWELHQDNIPAEVITDNMAGHFIKSGEVDLCVVGTDRTAANGDVANKIGTYMVALAAHANDVPFYVAAPTSSIDMSLSTGTQIPIEERSAKEVTHIKDHQLTPDGVPARHVAFDVTPARYVTALITENGVASPPYVFTLPTVMPKI
ncbi:MAG: S-methyl-5-thioribose-1-phosphate isomerase [Deltaproteobacteria bacterium]|nr:S-methyl-5-thioribose-1-phosphate isomerase [Deltaproteobacteria bacterium]|tara:strand:+ start:34806 stop:35849 length:1044 start_codon:yes stop_codon:yes gene_type:complete